APRQPRQSRQHQRQAAALALRHAGADGESGAARLARERLRPPIVKAGGPIIRAARPEDIPAIRAIHRAAWSVAYCGIVPDAAIGTVTAISDDAWATTIAEERPGLYVAAVERAVIGWVRMQGRLIKSLHVDPEHHGGGI